MKNVNLIIIETIIVTTFVISMFAFQPTITEANDNVSPTATPSPRKMITKRKTSTGVWEHSNIPPSSKVKPSKNPTSRKIKPRKSKGFTEVTGLDIQVERRKHSRRKSVWGMETNYRKKPQNISNPIGTDGNIAVRRNKTTRKRKN